MPPPKNEGENRQQLLNGSKVIKRIVFTIFLSFFITYLTLFIPREITVTRSNVLDCEKSCEIAAAGFPIPYLVDGYTSPIGSISTNPIIILFTKTDIFFLGSFITNLLFWCIVTYLLLYKILYKRKRKL